jgi:hypothetical protein
MTGITKKWTPIVNGGSFSPFGRTDFLVADWEDGGSRAIADLNNRYPYLNGNVGLRIQRTSLYGQRGLTYGKRSDRFNVQVLREGSIFTFEGIGIFPSDNSSEFLFGLLAILNSRFVAYWLNLTAGLHKNDVYIRRLPFPFSRDEVRNLAAKGQRAHALMTEAIATEETSHFFTGKTFGLLAGTSLRQLGEEFRIADRRNEVELFTICHEIEAFVAEACLLDNKVAIEISIDQGPDPCSFESRQPDEPFSIPAKADKGRPGFCRWFETSSDLYRICIERSIHPATACAALNKARVVENETLAWLSQSLFSYGVGCIFGRWDIRYATGEQPAPKLPDPFSPLPFCPLGQLQNSQGLPAQPEDMPSAYPVRISWEGIFVDDPNHTLDIVRRVREVVEFIWSGQEPSSSSEAIEQEACEILNVNSLRDYFRKPTGFFAEHLKCYSKSRRQAPIYWQLSAGNGSYSVWLYYHSLTQDTLYRVQRDFVEPRIQHAEREILEYESQGALSGDAATRLQETHTLLQVLRTLRSELDLVAPIWNPNLNDGVIINHAVLWRITPYTPWQKKCKECWDKLAKGDYDWAHLAFHLWPERVIRKCQRDRSLAIAHGLEELLWQETNKGNGLPRQLSEAELHALISEHTKPAVKNALERFLAAPPPVAPTRTRAPRATRSSASGTTRKPRGSAAVVDAEATRQVLLALTAAPSDGLAKAAIADLIGVEANALTAVIKQLKDSGQIDQMGERRGARYVLSEQGRVAVASETEVEA